ncbi:metallophosphoesterase [Paenibacillus sp. FSL H8-0548]|uniref:purple acid phosphatase family protein n=1 Tax=Paenibacillus sp. FSL H8-0548 TaxID=1920422 RepID=UPI00096CD7C2|nr:metallophosphoesterase family protein [Paenibacillus sp. FSL H8-0548]OMF29426.1 metallophosphoesterase [Paenibacillus sp. FSL H8-0548]
MRLRKDLLIVLVCCILLIAGVVGAEWLKSEKLKGPQAIVTTFKSDPKTSRAFTWHSIHLEEAAVVQVMEEETGKSWDDDTNTMTFTGTTTTIEIEEGKKQAVHKVEATGLEPGMTYSYRVGSGEEKGWSASAIFKTEAADTDTFSFINVTDSQGVTEQDFELWGNTLDKAFGAFPDSAFIVHNGDLTEEPSDEQAWTHLFAKASKWITQVPFMPVTGNHDEVDGQAERFAAHFNLPENGAEGSITGTNYSFDYGTVHFVFLNTESNIKEQTKWLEADLESTDKPWKVVAVHEGPYGGNTNKKVKKWIDVFDEFEVDLVLQGHNHEYSRSYPLRSGEIVGDGESPVQNREGTVYVVTNTSGQKFNEKKDDQFYHKVHFQNGKQMFAGITVAGNTMTYQAYDVDGKKLDEFVLQH